MKNSFSVSSRRAFTLIELLIVVAIIAILAAIAVPNFLEAQVRSKVSRCKADMRSMAVAVESYNVDYNRAPIAQQYFPPRFSPAKFNNRLRGITTPIAYMTSLPGDVFWLKEVAFPISQGETPTFEYEDYTTAINTESKFPPGWNLFATRDAMTDYYGRHGVVNWVLQSAGPDKKNDFQSMSLPVAAGTALVNGTNNTYDPTNGTISIGDIARTNNEQRN